MARSVRKEIVSMMAAITVLSTANSLELEPRLRLAVINGQKIA